MGICGWRYILGSRGMGRYAAGSAVIFDYFRPKDTETALYKTLFNTITPRGEFLHTFFDHATVTQLFSSEFRILSDRLITEIECEYCPDRRTIDFASYLVASREPVISS